MILTERRPRNRQQKPDEAAASVGSVQSLARALSILEALATNDEGLTLTSLAKSVKLP